MDSGKSIRRRRPLINSSLENTRHRILSFDEERRLFAAFKKYKTRSNLAFAVMVALETGMRKSEQFRLRPGEEIDLDRRLIMALSYKGNRTTLRPVPITELLMPELIRCLAEITTDLLFDLKDPRKGFENACRDAGIKRRHLAHPQTYGHHAPGPHLQTRSSRWDEDLRIHQL